MGRACGMFGKAHEGVCQSTSRCHICGMEGHIARNCLQQAPLSSTRICYHYEQVCHVKASCPLLAARPVQAPAPTNLRITDGR